MRPLLPSILTFRSSALKMLKRLKSPQGYDLVICDIFLFLV